jgi:hypothetical protein
MEMPETVVTNKQVVTLETEVKNFIDTLPFWAKYLSMKLLNGAFTQEDIDLAYSYLLEENGLKESTTRPVVEINLSNNTNNYKDNLTLSKVQKVEGVNALPENQILQFTPNITIFYGSNGSGKTGYVRLFKNSFFSRAKETIISNIHSEHGAKEIKAEFTFVHSGNEYSLNYSDIDNKSEFEQFAVFDNKSVSAYLTNKNQYEFKPTGLAFFSLLIDAFKKVESKINIEITTKSNIINYADLFDGESEIKTALNSLSVTTKIEDIRKFLPLTEDEKKTKGELIKEHDELKLLYLNKEKEVKALKDIKTVLSELKVKIDNNNNYFSSEAYSRLAFLINDRNNKKEAAKKEGVDNFQSDKIKNIGGEEWKSFIESANKFATVNQEVYPSVQDNCLFCQQSLSKEAIDLIKNYWIFIKSQKEQEAKNAEENLLKAQNAFEKLDFNLLPKDSILFSWLNNNDPLLLNSITENIAAQKKICVDIITDIKNKTDKPRTENQIEITGIDKSISEIDNKIKELSDQESSKQLQKLNEKILFLDHKEKMNVHIDKIEVYINNLKWVAIANETKKQLSSRKITDKEKELSAKYFNQAYIDTFNTECLGLKGNFGVVIEHTGNLGTSYRQLKLKNRQPSEILSEGEQKVLSLADFLSEIKHSGINKGIIFDDPVNSLDEERKINIAQRLVIESKNRQVIIFTHDLSFVSYLLNFCEDYQVQKDCHWIEKSDNQPGIVWLKNTPSYEKQYRSTKITNDYYVKAKDATPENREHLIRNGFSALRTTYEVFVIFDLFEGVIQRFNDRVSVMSLSSICFDEKIVSEVIQNFEKCCKIMEGHTHSDKAGGNKPEAKDLLEQIQIFEALKKRHGEEKKKKKSA